MDHCARRVTEGLVKAYAGQRAHELEACKAARARLGFAALQQRPTNATAGMVGIDEESTDLGRIDSRVEFARIALGVAVTTKQRAPAAPAAAADQIPPHPRHPTEALAHERRG